MATPSTTLSRSEFFDLLIKPEDWPPNPAPNVLAHLSREDRAMCTAVAAALREYLIRKQRVGEG